MFLLFICKKKKQNTQNREKSFSFLGLGFGFRYDPLLSCCTINTLRFIVRRGGRHNYNLCPRWWWSPMPPCFLVLSNRLLSRQCRPKSQSQSRSPPSSKACLRKLSPKTKAPYKLLRKLNLNLWLSRSESQVFVIFGRPTVSSCVVYLSHNCHYSWLN